MIRLNNSLLTACLPSLRPILSLVLYGDANPSARGSKDSKPFNTSTSTSASSSRSWTKRNQPSAVAAQPNLRQPTTSSASDSQHNLVSFPDEAYGFSGTKHVHGTAVAGLGGRRVNENDDDGDIEMQVGGQRRERGVKLRSDVTVLSMQNR